MKNQLHWSLLLSGSLCFFGSSSANELLPSEKPPESDTAEDSRVARDLLRQAVQAEAKGDIVTKERLMDEAMQAAPTDPLPRWLGGQMLLDGKWIAVVDAELDAVINDQLAEYHQRRAQAAETIESQLELARWCQTVGLPDEARAHFTQLLELQPDHPEAIEELGLKLHGGLLINEDQIAAREAEAKTAEAAAESWKKQLAPLARRLQSRATVQQARDELQAIDDPNAVAAIEQVFSRKSRQLSLEAVKVLSRIPEQAATEALVRYAVLTDRAEVRSAAIEQLKLRRQADVVPVLLQGLTEPIESEVELVTKGDSMRFRHKLTQEQAARTQVDTTDVELSLAVPNRNYSVFMNDALAITTAAAMRTEKEREALNKEAAALNEKLFAVLAEVTGQYLAHESSKWWDWWHQLTDTHAGNSRPGFGEEQVYHYNVPYQLPKELPYKFGYRPVYTPRERSEPLPPSQGHYSCFVKGTPVWTMSGLKPIEAIKIGDRVLAQDVKTGELAYKPVLKTTLRMHRDMIKINAGADSIVSTHGHLFWVTGHGWRMAKELKVGDQLFGPAGGASVSSISKADAEDAYNLVVADFGNYFIGTNRILVHDNSQVEPTFAVLPGVKRKAFDDSVVSARR